MQLPALTCTVEMVKRGKTRKYQNILKYVTGFQFAKIKTDLFARLLIIYFSISKTFKFSNIFLNIFLFEDKSGNHILCIFSKGKSKGVGRGEMEGKQGDRK